MKKIYSLLLMMVILVASGRVVQAQQTIGKIDQPEVYSVLQLETNYKLTDPTVFGGLRLPQVDSVSRNKYLTPKLLGQPKAKGLMIYNTSINCVEYWNNTEWISLCAGSSIKPDCLDNTPFKWDGSSIKECSVTDPQCTATGSYRFTIISGAEYATVIVTDAGAGKFSLQFAPNDQATSRTAILMVESPCGTTGMFPYTQDGNTTGCGKTTVPDISSNNGNGTNLCGSGAAVYLYVKKPAGANDVLIWTLNGIKVGEGNTLVATQSGKYIVYGDKIGCTNSSSVTVTLNAAGSAPRPVDMVWASNNGLQCSAGDPVTIRANRTLVSPEKVVWYCDGLKQTAGTDYTANTPDGLNITTTKPGNWFAVVENGSCSSTPSSTLKIAVNSTGGTTPLTFGINVNDVAIASAKFCSGGSYVMTVSGPGIPETGATYTWYINGTQVGTGAAYNYNMPAGTTGTISVDVIATKGGECPLTKGSTNSIVATAPPAPPIVTPSTQGAVVCNGSSMTLNATGGSTYEWSKNGVKQAESSYQLTVTDAGTYTVRAINNGCYSSFATQTVTNANVNQLSWDSYTNTAKTGTSYLFSVKTDGVNPEPSSYTWTRTTGSISSTNKSAGSLTFSGNETVTVTATNVCGQSQTLSQAVTFSSDCTIPAFVGSTSDTTIYVVAGKTLSLQPVITAGDIASYSWSKIAGGGTISNNTSLIFSNGGKNWATTDAGTYQLTLNLKNNCTATTSVVSRKYIVVVNSDPSGMALGNGNITGKTCFDIAASNFGSDCGDAAGRASTKADFANLPANDKVYTFTATGAGHDLSFVVVDELGCVTSYSGAGISGSFTNGATATLTLNYNTGLNNENNVPKIYGRTTSNAAVVTIYAVFYNAATGGTQVSVPLVIKIQDCACCGAYVAQGVWKNFMCHNLGADYSVDPFGPVNSPTNTAGYSNGQLVGNWYQWGRKEIGVNSPANGGAITANWKSLVYAPANAWLDASKTDNDPCPAGYRVPTRVQWQGVKTYNSSDIKVGSWTASTTNFTSGRKIGNIYLPVTGYRSDAGNWVDMGFTGYYWSSSLLSTQTNGTVSLAAYRMHMNSTMVSADVAVSAAYWGMSIRCIAE